MAGSVAFSIRTLHGLVLSDEVAQEHRVAMLCRAVCELGLEGVVAKHRDSLYRPGPGLGEDQEPELLAPQL